MNKNKEELLRKLSAKISTDEPNREEATNQLNSASTSLQTNNERTKKFFHFSINKLYILGAVVSVAILALLIYIPIISSRASMFISDIFFKLFFLFPLIASIIFVAIGMVLFKKKIALFNKKSEDNVNPIRPITIHIIEGVIVFIGVFVGIVLGLSEILTGEGVFIFWIFLFASGAILVFYLLLNIIYKHPLLTFLTILKSDSHIAVPISHTSVPIHHIAVPIMVGIIIFVEVFFGMLYLWALVFGGTKNVSLTDATVPYLFVPGAISVSYLLLSKIFKHSHHPLITLLAIITGIIPLFLFVVTFFLLT